MIMIRWEIRLRMSKVRMKNKQRERERGGTNEIVVTIEAAERFPQVPTAAIIANMVRNFVRVI